MGESSQLIRYLRSPSEAVSSFDDYDWSMLVREARRANLFSRVAFQLASENQLDLIPASSRTHFESAVCIAQSSSRSVGWEVRQVYSALAAADIKFALLKGAAYELASLPPAAGRLFADVDILVAYDELQKVEGLLIKSGWMPTKLNLYDQQYYRKWMHELPPLLNIKRNTALDVHHTIIPPTAALRPDVSLLWQDSVELSEFPGMFVLSPCDMVLHSATHLFHDGDLEGGLRDLVDLDALLRGFSKEEGFWSSLVSRGQVLNLSRPLFYALKYCVLVLETPVPREVSAKMESDSAPFLPAKWAMDFLVLRAMDTRVDGKDTAMTSFAKWLLYVRSHYLRMPLNQLIPHLYRKAFHSGKDE